MYFTVIKYETAKQDFKLIHTEPAEVMVKIVQSMSITCKLIANLHLMKLKQFLKSVQLTNLPQV